MNPIAPATPLSLRAKLGLAVAVCIISLPLIGLGVAWLHPIGLIDAPPIHSQRLILAAQKTVSLAVLVTAFSLILGTFFAWIQTRWTFAGSQLLTRLSILPLVLPSFLLAATLREGFAPLGAAGQWLGTTTPFSGFWPTVLILVISCTPYVQLVMSAALDRLPRQVEHAAQVLGAQPRRVLREVILPALRPALGFSALLVLIYAAADFGAVAVMDTHVLTYELYQFSGRGGVQAPVIGLILIITIVPLILLSRRLAGLQETHQLSYNRGTSGQRYTPPSWGRRVGTLTLCAYLALGLVLPLSLIARWGFTIPAQGNLQGPFLTTLIIGLTAGLITLVFGGFPALLVSQSKRRASLETLTFVASGVPGVMIGFGLLQVALRLPNSGLRVLAEGGGLLCLGLALRFASHSYAALKPAFITQSQQSIEAAQLLGAQTWRIWTTIRMPHLSPALASGFLLSFVAVVKELPISLLLLPAGETTLATRIFDANDDAHLGDLGAASLLLLAMVLVAQALLWRWSRHEH